MSLLAPLVLALLSSATDAEQQINPYPRAPLPEKTVAQWKFDQGADGWVAEHDCSLSAEGGVLKIRSTGSDPFFHRAVNLPGGEVVLSMRARGRTGGHGSVFWTTDASPGRGEDQARHFPLTHDGQWREYRAGFNAPGTIRDLRLDPGAAPGQFEIEWIRLVKQERHPLGIERVETAKHQVRFTVKNYEAEQIEFAAGGRTYTAPGHSAVVVERPVAGSNPLEAVSVTIQAKNPGRPLPLLSRTVFLYHPDVQGDWIALPLDKFSLEVARDGSMARIVRGGQPVAVLAPLIHWDGEVPALKPAEHGTALRLQGDGVTVAISTAGNEVSVAITSARRCEGPVVRVLGGLEGGVFAGVEYLGKHDASSSRLDVENEQHLRFAPEPLKVTFPFMSLVTDRAAVAMSWSDAELQPVYATPNFFDATADHRMALRGTKIDATILVDRIPVEETIAWVVKKRGLPPLPPEPRSRQQQWELCLKALNGPLKTAEGWGHCAEPNWPRGPMSDMASTIWRLTGKIPEMPRLVPGGAHVHNGSIYFVTGRAGQWLDYQRRHAEGLLQQQQPDGSFRYDGRFRRGHFENTANGVCARPAADLLDYARLTGDKKALEAGLRTLDYMKRFDVPRGAQVWEIPLHTPDQLASAYAVWAYVRGYELTGKKEYLAEARRWALSGIPFTYLWTRYPIMLYATPPVFGATNWQAPLWIGLPVQWVGGVYAYALTLLAPYDPSIDWNHLARGILISAEQQQYPDGTWAGLLPDSFVLASQTRNPARINPCALVSLRLVLDGEVDFLRVAAGEGHSVAAPFPVTIRDGKAHLKAPKGLAYQVLVDGKVVDIQSRGDDVLPLR